MDRLLLNRREALQMGALGALFMGIAGRVAAAESSGGALITKAIPSSGERLPVVGIGTNAFRLEDQQTLSTVLSRLVERGSTLIDTAAGYGESEAVIGKVLADLKLRNKVFIATKMAGAGGMVGPVAPQLVGKDSFERSLQRLQTDRIDLMQVHNISGADTLLSQMVEWKKAGKIRYIGITTSDDRQHGQMAGMMREYPLDFVQVNYSLGLRSSEQTVLPLAQERKIAVITNVPLGGRRGSLLSDAKERMLPAWAADFGATSWAQLLLKYVVSHPAVTATITGMTKVEHVDDNTVAAHGKLPDAAQRKKIEEYWAGKA